MLYISEINVFRPKYSAKSIVLRRGCTNGSRGRIMHWRAKEK